MTDSTYVNDASGSSSSHPDLNSSSTVQSTKDAVVNNASAAVNTVQNAELTQNVKDTVSKGPVAENVKAQYNTTQNEFQNLANSRQRPDETAATGQQLTHYHSMFYSLLSWENPRATAIAFAVNVLFIFAARYINITSYLFKLLFYTLGITASAELIGKLAFSSGLTSQIRPKRYYTIPKDTLELVLDDVQELINFFVIEFQRVLFAENVSNTIGAFLASFLSYLLIKFLPLWGLTLIATTVLYLAPLVYVNNKEAIDSQLANASDIMSKQANQVKDIAGHHTARATDTVKNYAGDYSSKAQQYIGGARGRVGSPLGDASATTAKPSAKTSGLSTSDFPTAPKQTPVPSTSEHEPLIAT